MFVGALNRDMALYGAMLTEGTLTNSMRPRIGGSAPLCAIGAKHLGVETGFVTAIGIENEEILRQVYQHGVPFDAVFDEERMTATSFHWIDLRGRKHTIKNNGHLDENGVPETPELRPEDMVKVGNYLNGARALFITSFTSMPLLVPESLSTTLQEAKSSGVRTFFDMTEPGDDWTPERLDELLTEIIPHTEVVSANQYELYLLGRGPDDPHYEHDEMIKVESYMDRRRVIEYSERLLARGVDLVSVHYGGNGSVLVNHEGWVHARPPHRDGVINTVGAGNANCSGQLRALDLDSNFGNLSLEELAHVARYGNAAAAYRITGTEFPDEIQVKELVESQSGEVMYSRPQRRRARETMPLVLPIEDAAGA